MAFDAIYVPSAIVFDSAGTPINLLQLEDPTPMDGLVDLNESAIGSVGTGYAGSIAAKPEIGFGTTQLATALARMASAANYVSSGALTGITDFHLRKKTLAGTRSAVATADGLRLRMAVGMMVWESFSFRMAEKISGRFKIIPYNTDGVTNPVVYAGSIATPTTPTVSELFTFGKLVINGTTIAGVVDGDWNNNLEVNQDVDAGAIYPSYPLVDKFAPRLTVRCRNSALFNTYRTGLEMSSLVLSLRKTSPTAILLSNATAEHIVITGARGTVKAKQIQGADANVELDIVLTDTSGVWFTINTASAIS